MELLTKVNAKTDWIRAGNKAAKLLRAVDLLPCCRVSNHFPLMGKKWREVAAKQREMRK